MRKITKAVSVVAILSCTYFAWCHSVSFDVGKATEHLTENALTRSHNCCAWYVMRAMHSGGFPAIILPAWAYSYYLPYVGWHEVEIEGYVPQKGDVCVFPFVKHHIFGHIAMWNGHQWISDFKQNDIIVSPAYDEYKVFRHGDMR